MCDGNKILSYVLGFSFHAILRSKKQIMTKVNFNVAIEEVSAAVLKRYPLARFYKAQGYLTEDVDGDVKYEV